MVKLITREILRSTYVLVNDMKLRVLACCTCLLFIAIGLGASTVLAQPAADEEKASGQDPKPAEEKAEDQKPILIRDMVRVIKDYKIWLDIKRKWVVVDGRVCLREGELEMFACTRDTKEHESVVVLDTKSRYVHASLLAIGGRVGNVVRFSPEYKPASGTVIDLVVLWKDKNGKKQAVPAQEWIEHYRTEKPLEYPWVFSGSGFFKDEATMKQIYYGDAGDLVCVSNFTSATMDLPVQSSKDNSDLLYHARTKAIPPIDTAIRLVFAPRKKSKPDPKGKPKEKLPAVLAKDSALIKQVLLLEAPKPLEFEDEDPATPDEK
jgi:hypothetical protein